jgi:hypothetical protein
VRLLRVDNAPAAASGTPVAGTPTAAHSAALTPNTCKAGCTPLEARRKPDYRGLQREPEMLDLGMREQTIIAASAKRYSAHYGDSAADHARGCAAAMLIAGDVDGWRIWSLVIREIEHLADPTGERASVVECPVAAPAIAAAA